MRWVFYSQWLFYHHNLFKAIIVEIVMKNMINLIMVTVLVFSLGMVVATDDGDYGNTVITGIVYDASGNIVVGSNVTIDCNGHISSVESGSNGQYVINYENGECPLYSSFFASAEKNGMSGYSSGTVSHELTKFNLGIADITIVPEFGFFMGMLTLLSSIGIFFVVRKEWKWQGLKKIMDGIYYE